MMTWHGEQWEGLKRKVCWNEGNGTSQRVASELRKSDFR